MSRHNLVTFRLRSFQQHAIMKSALLLSLPLLAAATPEEYARIVKHVNSNPKSTWVAEQPSRFNSTDDAKQLCGTWLKDHPKYFRLPEREEDETFKVLATEDIPDSFDARTAWSNCTVISKVRDQSKFPH